MVQARRALPVGIGLAAASLVFASVVMASQPGPAYLAVQSFSAEATNANLVRLSAIAQSDIPTQADQFIDDNVIVGIAWADLASGTAVVATIHPSLGRDSHQRKDGWHLHTVQLAGGATAPNDFCLVEVLTTPTAGIQLHGSTIDVNLLASDLPTVGGSVIAAADLDAAVGFTVHTGDAGCATGLGVRVRT
jgi:hypothetical protein